MVRCPICGAEIEWLSLTQVSKEFARVYLDENGEVVFDDWNARIEEEEFSCPECGEVLFRSEEDAVNFLRSK